MDQLIEGCTEILTDVPLEITKESNSEGVSKGAGISLVAEYENGRLGANVLTSRNHLPIRSLRSSGLCSKNRTRFMYYWY